MAVDIPMLLKRLEAILPCHVPHLPHIMFEIKLLRLASLKFSLNIPAPTKHYQIRSGPDGYKIRTCSYRDDLYPYGRTPIMLHEWPVRC